MSQKGKQGPGSAKGKRPSKPGAENKTEDVLQAVVLADSFQNRFQPFTIEKPRCLLPLANIPLIEYTLEFLAMNGVEEVFIYCGAHTEQVEEYINRSRYASTSRTSPFATLQFIKLSGARSTGDVLRDLDKRSLIDGDFILVHGDLVSNILLDRSLAAHRKRREDSAANIMTLVLTSGGEEEHRTKVNAITPVFVVDAKNQRCLHYDEMHPLQEDRYVSIDPAIPDELSTEFELRTDLIDAQIDICTPEVLALWSESFDYELPRRNFLHGVLKDWELNGKMIYTDVIEGGYAARASNLQMYDAISRDVLARWTFPFIPENDIFPQQCYKRHVDEVVLEGGTGIPYDGKVQNAIIGRGSVIGPGCTIINSIIGRDCIIGAHATLENSFVWHDSTVGNGTRISHSIVADLVIIGDDCSIPAGSLVSTGVRISDNISLKDPVTLIAKTAQGEAVAKDTALLGPNTNAAIFADPDDEDFDDEDPARLQKPLIYSLAHLNLSNSTISTLASEEFSDDEDDPTQLSTGLATSDRERLSSFASDDSAGKLSFHSDAVHGLLDALRADSGDFDSAKLEFMGLRLANDASDAMMRKAVATAFARRAAELLTPEHGSLEPSKAANKAFTARPGASKFVDEVGVGGGEPEQIEFILALQRALLGAKGVEQPKLGTLLAAILQQLYDADVLGEEGILSWWEDGRADDGEGMDALKEKCKVLVDWLETADEESSEEDE
ncbi:hypothetical protein S7711_02163 [Stachybotrys chartarum IBT 7711]|uniref:Translation initiation factor eIF2B subunit epsilon n=1 Tax=Stachybotrys chartarum (strain CBS 109288 / IBT 7711) TaxID=1280523 RepID=A0A084ARM8_STACB|nr:hypothetical protein S7711_02163 [Stachybotrys chartarum IBT 7711]KFA47998.1 hypothetical protein S40293_02685 [Stachybotrys chartarum IBT 40293]KFA72904.1 hypothetical protein S40288_02131 [Stachybotrys chartarum IBT 40288]